jgi:hypothetical protein
MQQMIVEPNVLGIVKDGYTTGRVLNVHGRDQAVTYYVQ